MLKGIPNILSPELLKTLAEMGHGDDIIIADGNFPAASHAQRIIRADGHDIPEMLKAITQFLPIDTYDDHPVALMEVVKGDPIEPTIWKEYEAILETYNYDFRATEYVERFAFYERAKKAYAIVATSEKALYANIILKKGVVSE
ncbi:L-fucose mutarotase [Radiobacillus sp. PE A8.2]|uniref:L-fucose mutarotase n=1 Tax=Radiobacillus sp. PE A8.2 TaxID=3380349 RepID=UPI00388F9DF6